MKPEILYTKKHWHSYVQFADGNYAGISSICLPEPGSGKNWGAITLHEYAHACLGTSPLADIDPQVRIKEEAKASALALRWIKPSLKPAASWELTKALATYLYTAGDYGISWRELYYQAGLILKAEEEKLERGLANA